jgi:hypothetical protein
VLRLADDDLSDSNRFVVSDRFAEKRVRLVAAFAGHEIVGCFEVSGIDLVFLHEIEDVDRL